MIMRMLKKFQWNICRRYGGFKKVSRPGGFKVVERTSDKLSLSKALHLKIKAVGPITVADYMKTCLTNPSMGYYMQKDIIGKKGDFITSPEISQLFGEMIGIWIAHEFQKIGSPKPWQIVELGPGKGTLMKDVLRTLKAFNITTDLSVQLVEVSPQLASLQAQYLCSQDMIGIGMVPKKCAENPHYKSGTASESVPVFWYEKLEKVPKTFSVILAHEFFDALPIRKFQKVENEWREILIDSKVAEDGTDQFEYVLSKKESPMSKLLIRENEARDHVEISPEAGAIARQVAERLEQFGGFSLFIDYGHNGDKTDTFRAFKKHQLLDPLLNPGSADLTADVDFSFLTEVMKDKTLIFGPVEQADFLDKMGIKLRLNMLLSNAEREMAKQLESGFRMIFDKDQMGSRYKCFATFPSILEKYVKPYSVAGFF